MDVALVFLAIVGVFNVLLGTIILIHGPKNRANITYAVLVAALVLWLIAIVVLRVTTVPDTALFSLATAYLAGCVIAALFWHFVHFLTRAPRRILWSSAVIFGAIIISLLAFLSPLFIQDIIFVSEKQKELYLGPLHWVFIAYFVLVMAHAFLRLFQKYQASGDTAERTQLALVFTGTILTTVAGSILNIFLVELGLSQYIGWGPITTVIMVAFIGYAIVRHNLMNIRVISAELFALLLFLVLFARLVLSNSTSEALFTGITLIFAVGFGILLIRSVIQEVRDKERITGLATDLAVANKELKKLDAAKSEFISIASHQLRAPLTIIKGYVSLLLDGTLGSIAEKGKEAMAKVAMSAEQLIKLVGDLLNLSRIEAGKIQYDKKAINISSIVGGVVEEFKQNAEKKKIDLVLEKSQKLPPIFGDSDKLREVIINLVDNAIKYSTVGSNVTVSLKLGGGKILLGVKDSGIGIGKAEASKLFVKFGRTEEARKIDPNGMGIGLYFVKRVVEDHGGKVWVESRGSGKGSTFFVELPINQEIRNPNIEIRNKS